MNYNNTWYGPSSSQEANRCPIRNLITGCVDDAATTRGMHAIDVRSNRERMHTCMHAYIHPSIHTCRQTYIHTQAATQPDTSNAREANAGEAQSSGSVLSYFSDAIMQLYEAPRGGSVRAASDRSTPAHHVVKILTLRIGRTCISVKL